MVTLVGMTPTVVSAVLPTADGVTPLRALVLQAYWALRRVRTPDLIGTPDLRAWIRTHAPYTDRPSDTLVRVTLLAVGVPHRKPGRPRRGTTPTPVPIPPFCPTRRHPGRSAPPK